jgi:hypothetical protein
MSAIIAGAGARPPAAGHRGRADKAVSAGHSDPNDVWSTALFHLQRSVCLLGPCGRHESCARTDDAGGAGHRRAHGIAQSCDARSDQRAATGAEHLQVDMVMAGIDRRHHLGSVVLGDQRGGETDERRKAECRLAGCQRDATAGGNSHA